jgi:glycosyltransferase involved in cell wall biosynthesis
MIDSIMLEMQPESRIRVGWFGASFLGRSASGTAQVARVTIESLMELPERYQVIIFVKNEQEYLLATNEKFLANATIRIMPKVHFPKFQSSIQYFKVRGNGEFEVDVLHFSVARLYPFFWLFPAKKFFCTFHAAGDLSIKMNRLLISKQVYNLVARIWWKKLDAIISVSEFGRKEISKFYRIPKAAIRVIPNGVDGFSHEAPLPIFGLHEHIQYVVVVGRWQRYKNVHNAVKAVIQSNIISDQNMILVVVGNSNTRDKGLVSAQLELLPAERVRLFEYLTPGELVWLYRNSKMVIHPSLNEGFGLPAFEAFFEGARVMVHEGTPADQMLKSFKNVSSCDMRNAVRIKETLIRELNMPLELPEVRKEALREEQLFWQHTKKKYQDLYLEQTNY